MLLRTTSPGRRCTAAEAACALSSQSAAMQGGLSWEKHAKYQAVISLLLLAVVFMTTQEICFVRMAYAERHSSKGRLSAIEQQPAVGPLVYIGNSTTAARLGCTPAECSCFFSFQGTTPQEASQGWLSSWSQTRRTGRPASSCTFIYAAEWNYGQPRCECIMPEPTWLQREHPQPWRTVKQALVMEPPKDDDVSQLMHTRLFWIWAWLSAHPQLLLSSLELWVNCDPTQCSAQEALRSCKAKPCLDLNGHGLAAALVGRPHWLPLEQEPIVFEQVTFNLQGHAPYPRLQRMLALKPQDAATGAIYRDMAAQVMQVYGLQRQRLAQPPKIIIAQRSEQTWGAQRVMTNVEELAAALTLQGFEAQVVDLLHTPFPEMLAAVHDATVLAGISAPELVNGLFLPPAGILLEISPQMKGAQVVSPDLGNLMLLAGKGHNHYASPANATLLDDSQAQRQGSTILEQAGEVTVDIPSCVAAIQSAVSEALMT